MTAWYVGRKRFDDEEEAERYARRVGGTIVRVLT